MPQYRHSVLAIEPSVKEQICEQASYTLHHINRAKLFTENSAMARIRDILRGWGPADPRNILKQDSWCTILANRPWASGPWASVSDHVC